MAWYRTRGRTSDGRTRYYLEWRDASGERRGRTIVGRDEMLAAKRQIEDALATGTYVDPRAGGITLRAYAEEWMRTATQLRPNTRRRYESLLRNHIFPALGRMPLNRIRPSDVRSFLAEVTGKGLAPKSVRHAYTLVAGILRTAREDGLIASVPTPKRERGGRGVLPPIPRTEQRYLADDEVAALAAAVPPRYSAMIYLGAYAGLRWGEAAGLRASRIHVLERRVDIVETLDGEPKWGSAGTVRISAELADVLAEHLRAFPTSELVFTSSEGKPLTYSNFYRRVWLPAVKRAGLEPLRFHDLRHTAVALSIARGANPVAIQELLRHRSYSTTMNQYRHLFPALHDDLAERLGSGMIRTSAVSLPSDEPAEVVRLDERRGGKRR